MEFPVLEPGSVTSRELRSFGGYCHREHVAEGAFYDMRNMTGDRWPLLSPRAARGLLTTRDPGIWNPTQSQPQALGELDGLCVLSGGVLYYHLRSGLFQKADLGLSDQEPKQLIPFGTYLLVLPDKKYINTQDETDQGSIEAAFAPTEPVDLQIRLCSRDGTVCRAEESATVPVNPVDGQLWLDISDFSLGGGSFLMQYSQALERWESLKPACLRMDAAGIGGAFRPGDWIFLEGLEQYSSLRGICDAPREVLAAAEDYLVLDYPMGQDTLELTALQGLKLLRKMPELDFLFARENRLWGCRYGLDEAGNFVNRIYASKLGDFKNWYAFSGSDTDSFVADCSSDGPWTGAIHALGQPLFFKENYLHRVYGDRPSGFQIQTLPCHGVQEGCHKSLAVVNGVLYYKATHGVVCYDGSLPECLSHDLGEASYGSAVAGALGHKYYISMLDAHGVPQLFCYDTLRRFWHREDETGIAQMCTVKEVLYYIQEGEPLVRILAGAKGTETRVLWFVETGRLEGTGGQQQYLRRITVRLSMETGTWVRFWVQYDSRGPWQCLSALTGKGAGSLTVPLRLRRCDHLRLRIEGEGEALIYSLCLEQARGGLARGERRGSL